MFYLGEYVNTVRRVRDRGHAVPRRLARAMAVDGAVRGSAASLWFLFKVSAVDLRVHLDPRARCRGSDTTG